MTDATAVERLARLQSRRSAPTGQADDPSFPARPPTSRGRRRSPAAAAKIITLGGSTTAILGIMAGLGLAERNAQGDVATSPVLSPATNVVEIDPIPSTSVAAPTTPATNPLVPASAIGQTAPVTAPVSAPVPAPVPVPVAVDLAVPPPPPPKQQQPQQQAAPTPQATTSGS